jgi:DNA-binding transcriptional LysR family regulator
MGNVAPSGESRARISRTLCEDLTDRTGLGRVSGPLLDLRRLEVLRHVAEHGSFSAAAFALRYTPSAVSQQMALLEEEAGVPLLERHSRGVRLTPAGSALLRHAEAAVRHMHAAREELDALAGLRRGRLTMAAFGSAWTDLVPRAVAAFQRAHGDVELVLSEADPREGVAAVRAGELDLALVFEPNGADPAHRSALRVEPVAEDPLVAVLPAGHRLARRGAIALPDLAGERWALATDACAAQVTGACAAAGFTPEAAFASGDYAAVQGFVATGEAVALVPELAAARGRADLVVRPLAPPGPVRVIAVVRPAGGDRVPAAAAMVDALRAAAQRPTSPLVSRA